MYGKIITNYNRPSEEFVKQFEGYWAAAVADALGRFGAMDHTIRPLKEGMKVLGTALTVLCYPGDNLTVHKALQYIRPGDVLVIDCAGCVDVSLVGYNVLLNARAKGNRGLVTNGCIRDINDIKNAGIPSFVYGVMPRSPQKAKAGAINVPVTIGGIVVNPGDIIVGDDDGVVAVPAAFCEEYYAKAKARME